MSSETVQNNRTKIVLKICTMIGITALVGWGTRAMGIAQETTHTVSICTFISVICTTIFFWEHRVAAAFIGVALLVGTKTMTLPQVLERTDLGVIFFLVGMMIIVGALKDLGFLTWIIQAIISRKNMTGLSFTIILCGLSALLSSVVDEVSSIVVILALVFQVCDTLKIKSTPFVLIAVLATNIGSASTMLGNPVGILIDTKAHFTFATFLTGALPVAFVCLIATVILLLFWFRKPIAEMSQRMQEHRNQNKGLGPMVRIPHKRGLCVLVSTVVIIAFHHQIEESLGLNIADTPFLIITPLIIAGFLMICRPNRARHYVEHDVEWWTLLFFMLLFAISGSLAMGGPVTGKSVTGLLAHQLSNAVSGGANAMIPFVVGIASVGSAFVDNIVFVAAFTPVIQSLVEISKTYEILWWALLFGACFGGNITAIGSTANLVALGLLEKRAHAHIAFLEWLKIGAIVGLVTSLVAWGMLALRSPKPVSTEKTSAPAALVIPTDGTSKV